MTNRFEIIETPLEGLKVIKRNPQGDSRGYFERLYCLTELAELFNGKIISQINHTVTEKIGTIRGLHFQYEPFSETKLVMCLKGKVFDVAVDVRIGSPTFLRFHSEILSESNYKTLQIPEGFAHGFQTMTDDCEMLYFHTASYQPSAEGALNPMDQKLCIPWPFTVVEQSLRDKQHPMINTDFRGVML